MCKFLPAGSRGSRPWRGAGVLTRVGFLGKARWEGARGRRARRATIKALPAALHHPRPYGLTSTFPKHLPVRGARGSPLSLLSLPPQAALKGETCIWRKLISRENLLGGFTLYF